MCERSRCYFMKGCYSKSYQRAAWVVYGIAHGFHQDDRSCTKWQALRAVLVVVYIDSLVEDCGISCALAKDMPQAYTNQSM